jgi:hypothetical protein
MQLFVATREGLFTGSDDIPTRVVTADVDALSPGRDGCVLAIVDRHELVSLRDSDVSTVARTDEEASCVVATQSDVLVGTVGAHVLRLVDDGRTLRRIDAFDALDDRDSWTQPWGAPGDMRSFATDGVRTVYANVHVGGVLRSTDNGATWEQTIDTGADVHQIAFAGDSRVYAATGAVGFALSNDGARTWTYATDGLHGTYLRAVAPLPGGAIVSASTGPGTRDGRVYRWDAETHRFDPCNGGNSGLPARFGGNVDSYWIASTGASVACASPEGVVYRSDDAGVTWRELWRDLGAPNALLFA